MTRVLIALAAAVALSACATPPSPEPGGGRPESYALGERQPGEAPALARQAAARGDHRLIGFIGFALVFPGADPQAAERLGYRVIDAGGDNFTSEAQRLRADRAYAFAQSWNLTMLAVSP